MSYLLKASLSKTVARANFLLAVLGTEATTAKGGVKKTGTATTRIIASNMKIGVFAFLKQKLGVQTFFFSGMEVNSRKATE